MPNSLGIVRIENGKVVEEREESDMLGLMRQLGMELKPKDAERGIHKVPAAA